MLVAQTARPHINWCLKHEATAKSIYYMYSSQDAMLVHHKVGGEPLAFWVGGRGGKKVTFF